MYNKLKLKLLKNKRENKKLNLEVITINLLTLDRILLTKIYIYCNATERRSRLFEKLNTLSKPIFLIIYGFYVIFLFYSKNNILPRFIFYPFLLLILNIALRKVFKRQRPFKDKKLNLLGLGESKSFSFPSNHASSSIVISLFIYYINPVVASVVLFLAVATSFCRVARGYHYPLDIVFSALLATIVFLASFIIPIVL